jgi:hypothetical protein
VGLLSNARFHAYCRWVTAISMGITNAAAGRRHIYEWSILTSATVGFAALFVPHEDHQPQENTRYTLPHLRCRSR